MEVDGIKHYQLYYIDSKNCWFKLEHWMVANQNFGFEFAVCKSTIWNPVPEILEFLKREIIIFV